MEGVTGQTLKLREAESQRIYGALGNKWHGGLHDPLDQAASTFENAYIYKPYLDTSEPRQLMAEIALKIPVNAQPTLQEEEA